MVALQFQALLTISSVVAIVMAASPYKLEFMEEWTIWKYNHGRVYLSEEVS